MNKVTARERIYVAVYPNTDHNENMAQVNLIALFQLFAQLQKHITCYRKIAVGLAKRLQCSSKVKNAYRLLEIHCGGKNHSSVLYLLFIIKIINSQIKS